MHAGHFLTRAAQRYPDRPAWLEGDRAVSFRQAEARVNQLARALPALGGQPGKRHLASYKKPQSVEFLSQLPKNAYGKVLKRELRERHSAGRARSI